VKNGFRVNLCLQAIRRWWQGRISKKLGKGMRVRKLKVNMEEEKVRDYGGRKDGFSARSSG